MVAREFSKPQPARQLEARARAKSLGVRVAVVVEARRYVTHAQSQPGVTYTVERTPVGWACECQGFYHTGMCKHLGAVERRSERDGWAFGTVAPLSQVARYFPLGNDPQPEPPAPAALPDLRERGRRALADLYGDAAD